MKAALNVLRTDKRITDQAKVSYNPYFDTIKLVSTSPSKASFFLNGVGQGVSAYDAAMAKTDADTNWPTSNYLAAGTRFVCGAVRLILDPTVTLTAAADLALALRACVLRIKRNGGEILGPVTAKLFPSGTGIFGSTSVASTTLASFGVPDPRAVAGFGDLAFTIFGGEKFEATLEWPHGTPAITNAMYMHIVLDGCRMESI